VLSAFSALPFGERVASPFATSPRQVRWDEDAQRSVRRVRPAKDPTACEAPKRRASAPSNEARSMPRKNRPAEAPAR
jgi:hypothetical protein